MKKDKAPTEVGQLYDAAHVAHYKTKDLQAALAIYRTIMAAHPDTEEAKNSRTQIYNIVQKVIPEQALFDAQVALTTTYFEHQGSLSTKPNTQR